MLTAKPCDQSESMTSQSSVHPEAFDAFEHAGWERAALSYATFWDSLTRQAVEPLLDAVGAAPGTRLLGAGFTEPEVTHVPQLWRLPSPDALFEAMYHGSVRMAGLLRAQEPEALHAIRAALRGAADAYVRDGVVELPMPAVLECAACARA